MFQAEGESFLVSPQCCSQETLVFYVSELSQQLLLRVSKVITAQLPLNLNSPGNWKTGYYLWQNVKMYNKPAPFTALLQFLRFLTIVHPLYSVKKKCMHRCSVSFSNYVFSIILVFLTAIVV